MENSTQPWHGGSFKRVATLSGHIVFGINISFVERRRTTERAIQVNIRYRLAYITSGCKSVSRKVGDRLELRCNPRAGSQSRPTADLDGHCGPTFSRRESDPPALPGLLAVRHGRSQTNEISRMSLFPTETKRTTRRFLVDLHRRYQLDGVEFLVDDASYLGPIPTEDGYRFQTLTHGKSECSRSIS